MGRSPLIVADLLEENIMFEIDPGKLDNRFEMFRWFEKDEEYRPKGRKVLEDRRTVYKSRAMKWHKGYKLEPVITGFSSAHVGEEFRGVAQPASFRAPEVVLELSWDTQVDI